MSVTNDCNTDRCVDGSWVTSTLACAPRTPRVVALERTGPVPIRAELLVTEVPRVARPSAGKDFAPEASGLSVRLINTSASPVKFDVGGDTFAWKFKLTGPVATMTRAPDCTQRLAAGTPVELAPGAFIEVPVPLLADNDRCAPTQYTWTVPGTHAVSFQLSVGVNGLSELAFHTATPLPITVK